jgi:hypothetical protein
MTIVIWAFLAVLTGLVLWEMAFRMRQRWRRRSGTATDVVARTERYYAPEAETQRELDAAARRAIHSAAVGMNRRAEPRRTF